ncbi:hypothetical protein FXV77_20070 [Sphingobacterium phlebotomi]|uniref:DUF3299 domain-containing protein n=1 Tax=Sphingobacterium phlebotomi TaxID=2605433 RepID=A0A5D4GWD7_9SPHI|nr:hypothetical protein [Sphingobacterium phlebotomi]TYR32159.1 hypothetical protein FXV77_20070 [Sphingobacterium phlebotomi]
MLKYILTLILSLGLACFPPLGCAQQPPTALQHLQDHKPLMNKVWETFDMLMYKVTKENAKTVYTPHFPAPLAALDGKTVELQGYMIPIKSGFRHNTFMLSVLPIQQCMFCGQNGIPAMVEITLSNGKKERMSDRPVTIKGKTVLNRQQKDRLEIWVTEAVLME